MKKCLFAAVLFFTAVCAFAQESVKGYYVSATGQKKEGYFKYTDFTDVSLLRFSESEKGDYQKISSENVKEYGVGGRIFTKLLVDIDADGGSNKLALSKEADYVKKEVYLELLLKSNVSLYVNTVSDNEKFFYKQEGDVRYIQLVYRRYKLETGQEALNTEFRRQLAQNFLCKGESPQVYAKTAYSRQALTDALKHYNDCTGHTSEIPKVAKEKSDSHFALLGYAGVMFASNKASTTDYNFSATDGALAYRAGVEVSFYNEYKGLSFFGRAGFDYMDTEVTGTYAPGGSSVYTFKDVYKVSGISADIAVGPRYSFSVNDEKRIYIDGTIGILVPLGTKVTMNREMTSSSVSSSTGWSVDAESGAYFSVGAGYYITEKISAEVRYIPKRNYLENYINTSFNNSGVTLNVLYRLM
ncbi:hypothetical protein ACLI1A_14275 [Flavobacterium sp. RHBU_3]|uniref:hypothetical protein n=1 Tax=Flavobacterium sp. RHBU_3 TaxID=3391184 RepID=UPI0039848C77